MARTTPARPVDVEAVFPELMPFRREATRLHPRAGAPGPWESSVGGPLLWPAPEPWPYCEEEHPAVAFAAPEPGAKPLVPVVQLFARDVPDLPFPDGTDVLQVLWCPFDHHDVYAPRPALRWRDSAACGPLPCPPPRPGDAPDDYVPGPCVIHPESIVEFPQWDLPEELHEVLEERFDQVEKETGWSYWYHLSVAPGIKTGGYPDWTQEAAWPLCGGCGEPMRHLLTVGSAEFDGASWQSWLPLEDTPASGTVLDLPYEDRDRVQRAAGLMLGDMGGVYLFVCTACPDMPHAHRFDCS
ncbi:DUF1963 domain-containing protein [Streptacidiphilus sp. 4-A2]|nr:DUF1963 domain-containing protein [Streptacidiphilus sp. 4-A2]